MVTEWYANVPTPVVREEAEPDPVPTEGSLKRKAKEQRKVLGMKQFLEMHKFEDVNEPQQPRSGCCFVAQREQLYPVHLAAQQGNAEVVASLLRAGADKDQLTSKGRSALQLARTADVHGSHLQVIEVLEGKSQKESKSVLNFANTLQTDTPSGS
mmetsp:Transcript_80705/g.127496  ORF Transcript_80705/g.127496 Transcript_80705/m.127496 type:complete len:155 (-) Transcript_80705:377-841(-)